MLQSEADVMISSEQSITLMTLVPIMVEGKIEVWLLEIFRTRRSCVESWMVILKSSIIRTSWDLDLVAYSCRWPLRQSRLKIPFAPFRPKWKLLHTGAYGDRA